MGKENAVHGDFHRATEDELECAYAAYLTVFEWLNAKGVRQWLRALPQAAFRERQEKGELFVYLVDNSIAAVVTLAHESSPYWSESLGEKKAWWIKTLAVVRKWRHTGVGAKVMHACETFAQQASAEEIILDCVDVGFLPSYYSRLGYEEIGRKDITDPSGNTFLVTLMRKKLPFNEPSDPTRLARPESGRMPSI